MKQSSGSRARRPKTTDRVEFVLRYLDLKFSRSERRDHFERLSVPALTGRATNASDIAILAGTGGILLSWIHGFLLPPSCFHQ
jgi:hypothetical protein